MSAGRFVADTRRVLELARAEIGTSESPPHSNKQKYGAWFGWNGVAWCAIFVSWLFHMAGRAMPALSNAKGAAYVPAIVEHAKKTGQWRPRSSGYVPKPGDLIVFWFTNRPDHIAVVVARLADGRDWTIEGNSNAGGSRTGGSVVTLHRRSGVHGYVCVDETQASIDYKALRRYLAGTLHPAASRLPRIDPSTGSSNPSAVRTLQESLNVVKDARMAVTGVYDGATFLHVADWQAKCRALGLRVDDPAGVFGDTTKWWLCTALANARDGRG